MQDIYDVVVIDSGVGGLSIVEQVRQLMPDVNLCYLADHDFFPYGTRSEKEVLERISHLVSILNKRFSSKIFIIACNTASTVVLPKLRNSFAGATFIGVVPAIKPAALMTKTGSIALLATPATIERPYTDKLIRDFASELNVLKLGHEALALQAERKLKGYAVDTKLLEEITLPLQNKEIDTVVLGCTHYPFIKAELAAMLPHVDNWVDPAKAIANRLQFLCDRISVAKSFQSKLLTSSTSLEYESFSLQSFKLFED